MKCNCVVNAFPSVPRDKRVEIFCVDVDSNIRCAEYNVPCDYEAPRDDQVMLSNGKKFYKIFAQREVSEEEFLKYFEPGYKIIKVFDWYAYPKYDCGGKKFPKIIIDSEERSRVFNLNAIEWAASCIEMSCISARNVALMISKKVQGEAKTREVNIAFADSLRMRLKKAFAIGAGMALCVFTSFLWLKK